jgi:DNA-binding response OmpR family regulator
MRKIARKRTRKIAKKDTSKIARKRTRKIAKKDTSEMAKKDTSEIAKKRILLIDDDAELANMVKMRLEASNYEIIVATDGERGMEILRKEKPALVILDVRMPKKDGYTFMKEARVNNEIKHIPIIVLTGMDSLSDMFKLEGARDYIVKPFDSEKLLEKINKYL